MDVHAFLQSRLAFLEQLYRTTSTPYIDRKKLIEAGLPPYESTTYEDAEPPFLAEWLEADQSLRVLGQMFISAIASSLQLYLKESLADVRRRVRHQRLQGLRSIDDYSKTLKKEGWFTGYQKYFVEQFDIDFHDSGCNLNIMEGLVLARNRSQHPDTITSLDVRHSEHDLKKVPNPFFADKREMELIGGDQFPSFFLPPTVTAKEEKLEAAISETKKFCEWLETRIWEWTATP